MLVVLNMHYVGMTIRMSTLNLFFDSGTCLWWCVELIKIGTGDSIWNPCNFLEYLIDVHVCKVYGFMELLHSNKKVQSLFPNFLIYMNSNEVFTNTHVGNWNNSESRISTY